MNIPTNGGVAAEDRFDRIEALLRRYPAITDSELEELKHWFRKKATAFEVASLASKEDLRGPYTAFRSEHIDRFNLRDAVLVGAVVALVLGGLIVLVLLT